MTTARRLEPGGVDEMNAVREEFLESENRRLDERLLVAQKRICELEMALEQARQRIAFLTGGLKQIHAIVRVWT